MGKFFGYLMARREGRKKCYTSGMGNLSKLFSVHPRPEMKELYIFSIMFSFASSMIIIFEPVFFYQEGFPLWMITLYYALHYTLYLLILPWGGKFAAKFGLERSLSVAMPIFVAYFLMLAVLPKAPWIWWLAWVVLAVFKALYWPAYNAVVSKFGDAGNQGTELSWLYAITRGVGVLGPMIGGVVVVMFGFPVLFVVEAGLALVSVVPLLRTKEKFRATSFAYTLPWRVIMAKGNRRIRWGMLGWGEDLVDSVYWPIFMFIILGAADTLGYVASLNILLMTLLGFVVGEMSDRMPRRKILRLHIPFMFIGYMLRPLAGSPIRVLFTESLSKAAYIGVRIPYFYARGRRVGPLRMMVALEMQLSVAKALVSWALVGVFLVVLPSAGFTIAFVLAGFMALAYLLI